MPPVNLRPLHHRQQECIGIYYANHSVINNVVRKIPGIKWSQTNKCWYLPLNKDSYSITIKALKEIAVIDSSALKTYLQKRKQVMAATAPATVVKAKAKTINLVSPAWKLSKENLQALEKFIEQLKLKAYSPSTISTYRNEFLQLLQLLKNKPVSELTTGELRRYFVYCYEKLGLTENTLHSRINSIKFYFEQVLKREKFFWEIPRPKKPIELPKIFNQDEVAAIINSVKNKKHKAMLMLAYSAGLRVSEVVSIKTHEIDSKRMTILVRQAKGKKDRIVSLSPVLLVMLREYAMQYKPDKSGYLFEGITKGTPYSTRSLQEVIQAAKNKAGIIKPGSIHSLRHSFATHLIDKGTDVTMIQKLLGHNDIKTTLRYLHTSNKDLLKIISPLDDLPLT
ncbi:tyrosine-type recombinase/integrase [Terrimonas alba]|uniref:tyrosine-type recombinase/integrase n=1 Tax=Terrimonas alba TaxID=3349636 RepID=UPI0035F451A0